MAERLFAVIMAGGKGTRLASVTGGEIPKPMVPVLGKPLLEHQIDRLRENGVTDVVLVVGHLHEKIQAYFGDGSRFGVSVRYIVEREPLGSAGALFYLKDRIENDFFLVFGDTVFDIDLARMMRFHREKGAAVTLFAHPNSHPYDSDIVLKDQTDRVIGFLPKGEERNFFYRNLVNAAFYVLSPRALEEISEPVKTDMEKGLVASRIQKHGDVFCYVSAEYIKDAGTAERLTAAERDLASGAVAARNRKNLQKCVFLDRDGTLNRYIGLVTRAEQLELLPGAAQAVRRINEGGWLAVLVTNQPVLARGDCTVQELDRIHAKLETLLGREGAYLDGIYYCPHHPDRGYAGEVEELKIECDCRKPKPGLLLRAAEELGIDLAASVTVGDSFRDVEAGRNAGTRTVHLTCGAQEEIAVRADATCADLSEAVKLIFAEDENG